MQDRFQSFDFVDLEHWEPITESREGVFVTATFGSTKSFLTWSLFRFFMDTKLRFRSSSVAWLTSTTHAPSEHITSCQLLESCCRPVAESDPSPQATLCPVSVVKEDNVEFQTGLRLGLELFPAMKMVEFFDGCDFLLALRSSVLGVPVESVQAGQRRSAYLNSYLPAPREDVEK